MKYVITNGKNFLTFTNGQPSGTVHNSISAYTTDDYNKICNMVSNLPKSYKNLGYCVSSLENILDEESKGRVKLNREISFVPSVPEYGEILKITEDFDNMVDTVFQKKEEIQKSLGEIEGRIVDTEHFIEFNSVNAVEGYKLYKQLHDLRNERRRIKDTLLLIYILEESLTPTYQKTTISSRLQGMKDRVYRIRQDEKIFEKTLDKQ